MNELVKHIQMMSALIERFFDTRDINFLTSANGHAEAVTTIYSHGHMQRALLQMLEMKYKISGELGGLHQAISIIQQIATSTARNIE